MPSRLRARFLPQAFESIRKKKPVAKTADTKRVYNISAGNAWYGCENALGRIPSVTINMNTHSRFCSFFSLSFKNIRSLATISIAAQTKLCNLQIYPASHMRKRLRADPLQQCKGISSRRLIRRFSWASTTRSTSSALALSRRTVFFSRFKDTCRVNLKL